MMRTVPGAMIASAIAALALLLPARAHAQDPARGLERYTELACANCHGSRAEGARGRPALAGTALRLDEVRLQVRAPRGRMPAFSEEELSERDLEDIYAYLRRLPPPTLADKATWWGTDGLNLPTPRLARKGGFEIHFTHRFSDSITDAGLEGLYGLDSFAFPGFWFSYGLNERIAPYAGRTSNLATWEYGVKFGLLREGELGIPVSIAATVGGSYLDADGIPNNSRFVVELPIGVRLGDRLALQAVPFYATNPDEQGDPDSPGYALAIGLGASVKLSTRFALEAEWIRNLAGFERQDAIDQWQAGFTIDVGQHLFQLMATNAIFSTPDFMAGGAIRTSRDSNIRLGFNIVREFSF